MRTSYYARYKGENGVSIAGWPPEWYTGRQFKKLAPKWNFFSTYKEELKSIEKRFEKGFITESQKRILIGCAEKTYVYHYYKQVLDYLDPKQVYEELGADAVLLCWETPEKFCHRHIVAEWLSKALGIEILEID